MPPYIRTGSQKVMPFYKKQRTEASAAKGWKSSRKGRQIIAGAKQPNM